MAKLADLERELGIIKPLVQEHDKVLIRGNGEPSLLEEMRNVKRYIEDEKENRRYYIRLITGIAATNVIALIFAAIAWFIKILPVLEQINKMQQTSF